MPDKIIEELWGIKDTIAREHNSDVRKIAAYLQQVELRKHSPGAQGGASDDNPRKTARPDRQSPSSLRHS